MWSSVREPIIIEYTSARVIHATPQCMPARYSFDWLGYNYLCRTSKRVWFLCPRLTSFCCCCAKHLPGTSTHIPSIKFLTYVQHPFCLLRKQLHLISQTQMTCQLGPGAYQVSSFLHTYSIPLPASETAPSDIPNSDDLPARPRGVYPNNLRGGGRLLWPGAFVVFLFDTGRLLRIFFAKNSAPGLNTAGGGVYSYILVLLFAGRLATSSLYECLPGPKTNVFGFQKPPVKEWVSYGMFENGKYEGFSGGKTGREIFRITTFIALNMRHKANRSDDRSEGGFIHYRDKCYKREKPSLAI